MSFDPHLKSGWGWRRETGLSPPVKYFTDRFKAVLLLWISYVCFCLVFAMPLCASVTSFRSIQVRVTLLHIASDLITGIIYSTSMKSYQYWNFDISENILYSSLATVTFMFLVNDKLVWGDKTVTRALELWCTWCTCILCFSQFFRIWNHHFRKTTCQNRPKTFSLKTPLKWFRLPRQTRKMRIKL